MKLSAKPTPLLSQLALGILALLVSSTILSAKPKTAMVDVQHIFQQYHKTITAQAQISEERAKIEKDSVNIIQTLNNVSEQLNQMRAKLQELPADSEERRPSSKNLKSREVKPNS